MNVADSQRVAAALEGLGYHATRHAEEADVIVLNTCVVRQSAEDKAVGRLFSLWPLKEQRPDLVVNLMGCLVGVKGTEHLQERFPFVDVFSPPSDPGPLIAHLTQGESHVWEDRTHGSVRRVMAIRKRSAFTLVELLVVGVIISILMSLLLVGLKKSMQLARMISCTSRNGQMLKGLEMWLDANNGLYPPMYADTNDPSDANWHLLVGSWLNKQPAGEITLVLEEEGAFVMTAEMMIIGKGVVTGLWKRKGDQLHLHFLEDDGFLGGHLAASGRDVGICEILTLDETTFSCKDTASGKVTDYTRLSADAAS